MSESKYEESKKSESKTGDEDKSLSRTRKSSVTSPKANSTSTLYLTSTIAVPNNDETILAVSTVLQCQMLDDPKAISAYLAKAGTSFDYFNDDMYISKFKRKPIERASSVEEIYKYMSSIFEIAQFSPECNVIALVYIQRLMAFSGMALTSKNWRPLVLSALLLAQKVWDDKCLANVDFPLIWRAAVPTDDASLMDLKAVNSFEKKFLELLSYNVTVSSSLYAKYYFELRSLCEANVRKINLAPLTTEQASRLEANSASTKIVGESTLKETRSAMYAGDMTAARSRAVIS